PHHIPIFFPYTTLFRSPNIKFILVDPSPFEIFFQNPEYTHLNSGNDIVVTIKFNPDNQKNSYNFQVMNFFDHSKRNPLSYTDEMLNFISNSKYKIYIIQDFYTNDLSKFFNSLNDKLVFFWSDIRTKHISEASSPNDMDILWNLAQQFNWIKFLKPNAFMLKHRCPYFSDFKDHDENYLNSYIE